MVVIGTNAKSVWGTVGSLTIGSNTYAAVRGITLTLEYNEMREPVMFSTTPFFATLDYNGAIDIETIYTTDQDVTTFLTLSNGLIPLQTVVLALTTTETTPTTDTYTMTSLVRFNRVEITGRQLGFITLRASGQVLAAPTLT